MEGLGFDLRNEAHLRTLTEDVIKSSEIEGQSLPLEQVAPPRREDSAWR
jgi:hypothetical protein